MAGERVSSPAHLALAEADLVSVATSIDLELACIKAVREVEAPRGGFLPGGEVTILFEGHILWRQFVRRGLDPRPAAKAHPTVLYPQQTRAHYVGGIGEYRRLGEASELALEVCGTAAPALASTSWGMFQLMGFNHKPCGFASVEDFVAAMRVHEREHLAAFVRFIANDGLLPHLRAHDWARFAAGYNGLGYKANEYDTKLAAAHARYAGKTKG